jgi:hypothetical protein
MIIREYQLSDTEAIMGVALQLVREDYHLICLSITPNRAIATIHR